MRNLLLALSLLSFPALADLVPSIDSLVPSIGKVEGLKTCGVREDLVIKDETLKLEKDDARWAIVTEGSCKLTLENVVIDAPRGIYLGGSTKLTLNKVTFVVAGTAIEALGSTNATLNEVTLTSAKGSAIIAGGAAKVVVVNSGLTVAGTPFAFTGAAKLEIDKKSMVNGKPWKRPGKPKKKKLKRKKKKAAGGW